MEKGSNSPSSQLLPLANFLDPKRGLTARATREELQGPTPGKGGHSCTWKLRRMEAAKGGAAVVEEKGQGASRLVCHILACSTTTKECSLQGGCKTLHFRSVINIIK